MSVLPGQSQDTSGSEASSELLQGKVALNFAVLGPKALLSMALNV